MNFLSNYVYRHLLLKHGADFVFSELIMVRDLDKQSTASKIEIIEEDIPFTIFQLGVSSPEDIHKGVTFLKKHINGIKEININMGCPQSTMQKRNLCGGLLHNKSLMSELAKTLSNYKEFTPSVKLRLGTSEDDIQIKNYLKILQEAGIIKVYIHTRPLRYNYSRPTLPNHFQDLEKKFPNMQLIYNGDIDSPNSAKNYKDVLIGRAALINPFIFQDIKNNITYRDGSYDPSLKDPHLIRNEFVSLSKEKLNIINEFLDLAIKHNLRPVLTKNNICYLLKGVSNTDKLIKEINQADSVLSIKNAFEASMS